MLAGPQQAPFMQPPQPQQQQQPFGVLPLFAPATHEQQDSIAPAGAATQVLRWSCDGVTLPQSLWAGITSAAASRQPIYFTLQAKSCTSTPLRLKTPCALLDTYCIDFSGPGPAYQLCSFEGRWVVGTVSSHEGVSAGQMSGGSGDGFVEGKLEEPLRVWPFMEASVAAAAGWTGGEAGGQQQQQLVAHISFREVKDELRFGLKDMDDFCLSPREAGYGISDDESGDETVLLDPETSRVEVAQALLCRERVRLFKLHTAWTDEAPCVMKGGKPVKGLAIVRLAPQGDEFQAIAEHFLATAPANASVVGAMRIQNKIAAKRFAAVRSKIWADRMNRSEAPWEDMLWHGCAKFQDLEQLIPTAFRPYYSQRETSINAFGKGTYFATRAALADKYACDVYSIPDRRHVRVMILAHVVMGDAAQGSRNELPPPKPSPFSSLPFDSFVDNAVNPNICVTTLDSQALQLYVVLYERCWPEEGAHLVTLPPTPAPPLPAASPTPPLFANHAFNFIPPTAATHTQPLWGAQAVPAHTQVPSSASAVTWTQLSATSLFGPSTSGFSFGISMPSQAQAPASNSGISASGFGVATGSNSNFSASGFVFNPPTGATQQPSFGFAQQQPSSGFSQQPPPFFAHWVQQQQWPPQTSQHFHVQSSPRGLRGHRPT